MRIRMEKKWVNCKHTDLQSRGQQQHQYIDLKLRKRNIKWDTDLHVHIHAHSHRRNYLQIISLQLILNIIIITTNVFLIFTRK